MKKQKQSNSNHNNKDKKNENKSSSGRPTLSDQEIKTSHIFVNITAEQKKVLKEIADKESRSLSQLCVHALKQLGYIS